MLLSSELMLRVIEAERRREAEAAARERWAMASRTSRASIVNRLANRFRGGRWQVRPSADRNPASP